MQHRRIEECQGHSHAALSLDDSPAQHFDRNREPASMRCEASFVEEDAARSIERGPLGTDAKHQLQHWPQRLHIAPDRCQQQEKAVAMAVCHLLEQWHLHER